MKILFSHSWRPLPLMISLFTLSKISHSEILFSDGLSAYPSPYSSRVILTRRMHLDADNVYIIDTKVSPEQEQKVRDWAMSQLGIKYDYNSFIPPPIDKLFPRSKGKWTNSNAWQCSEFCAYGLELAGIKLFNDNEKKIVPRDLYKKLKGTV